MITFLRVLTSLLLCHGALAAVQMAEITNHWNGGYQGRFTLHPDHALHGWRTHLQFSAPIDKLEIWRAHEISHNPSKTEFVVENMAFDSDISAGDSLVVDFVVRCNGDQQMQVRVFLEGQGGGQNQGGSHTNPHTSAPTSGTNTGTVTSGGTGTATATTTCSGNPVSTRKDYGKALGLSILFYAAQRSGKLPADNPIPWRGDSAMRDGSDVGTDLTGGWYDAGDLVKFNFPMAWSAHVLAWGLTKWKDGYIAAGQLNQMYECIKTPLDYFLKCWKPDQQRYYAQVGNGDADHAVWGRPEDMTMARPAYFVDANRPGSDVAAETVAALASGAVAFKDHDPGYSAKLLTAAKSLYTFAKAHRGIYSNSMPEAKNFYGSSGDKDELCEAANWLYKATQDQGYLNDAKGFYSGGVAWAFSWDDKKVACQLLLWENTKDTRYKGDVESFVQAYLPGGGVPRTPCGMVWRDQWGSCRYAANAAFIALMASQEGIGGDRYKEFAMSQMNFILGDNKNHISYEIGYGNHFPRKPHHRASSCPGAGCSWDAYNSGGDNPHVLNGALVGGPDQGGNYADARSDYTKNEVTCDYNAGFQSCLAGLKTMAHCGNLPASPNPQC